MTKYEGLYKLRRYQLVIFKPLRIYKTKRSNNIWNNDYNLAETPVSVVQQFICECFLRKQTIV